ncbi:hypothetical protein C9374_014639 [Naegleria lovaniensis]|uniref:Rax2-like C-terminal domain-containing protein n=1 Tax=Naegleria lovaniensis TaxID=51637 RepID=A0AA88H0W5_NAELO|nr:uncharacterized protein C9374_014639 [Naegleria lovaniensis]KAG2389239.1 hypothetical protein C9374_014639 [Naegleria lovaniensis]
MVATATLVMAANPFDTSTQPFAIGGAFKRLEKKSPSTFACYNSTLSDWAELRWGEVYHIGTASYKVQLKTGEVIFIMTNGGNHLIYVGSTTTVSPALLSTKSTVIQGSISQVFLSFDHKKLYVAGSISRVGGTTLTSTSGIRVISFSISSLTQGALTTYTEHTSNYALTNTLSSCVTNLYALGNGNLVCYQGTVLGSHSFIAYDGNTWRTFTPASVGNTVAFADFLVHQPTGTLYAKGVDTTSRATSFYKYDSNSDFQNIRTLSVPPSYASAFNFVAQWTLGSDSLYYTLTVGNNVYDSAVASQNVQQFKLDSPATSVSLGTTRLSGALTRVAADNSSIAQYVTAMYYDFNIKKLVLALNTDNIYQVYGSRDTWSDDNAVAYRFQLMGELLAYDETSSKYVVPYGGGYRLNTATLLYSSAESGVTCVVSSNPPASVVYYRTWAPHFGLYDPAQDKFVADDKAVSGNVDTIFPSTKASVINAIENSHGNGIVYIGGYFRSINNVVYNSIVSRARDGTLSALAGGLLQVDYTYENFDKAAPGEVKKIIRSNDNRYLFVLGSFNRAGSILCNGLAIYNIEKATWSRPEGLFDSTVTFTDMDYDGRYLYVIGSNLVRVGKYVVKNVARYEVSTDTWYPMNGGVDASGSKVFVYNGKVVVYGPSTGSSVGFVSGLAVWDSNSWKTIRMDGVSQPNSCRTNKWCTDNLGTVVPTIYKGNAYFIGPADVKVPTDSSFSAIETYTTAAVPGSGFFNYPKSNTLGIASPTANNKFYEFNYNTMNLQHTQTRDDGDLADATIQAMSTGARFTVSLALLLVSLLVALLL